MKILLAIGKRAREVRLYACLIAMSAVVAVILNRAGIPVQIQEPIGALLLVAWLAGVFSERLSARHGKELGDDSA